MIMRVINVLLPLNNNNNKKTNNAVNCQLNKHIRLTEVMESTGSVPSALFKKHDQDVPSQIQQS